MNYTITQETFDSLDALHTSHNHRLDWNLVFTLPVWLRVWWQAFGSGAELYLRAVRQDDRVIGIAPLQIRDGTAAIVGSDNVCDYLDFVVSPGAERDFFTAMLDELRQNSIKYLDLKSLRPDSAAFTYLVPLARERGYEVNCKEEDVSLEMDLPPTWEEYMERLEGKQRHELMRKLRRLEKTGGVSYRIINDTAAVNGTMDTFLKLFSISRSDKSTFMTPRMESFFRTLADNLANSGLLKLGVLEIGRLTAAVVMCFDYNDCVYLYNSGYDPDYSDLSAGLISKAFSIRDSIEQGRKRFDFLKGKEQYKYYLGGKEVPLHHCRINIK